MVRLLYNEVNEAQIKGMEDVFYGSDVPPYDKTIFLGRIQAVYGKPD